jgi:transcriptional regulator with XRE-family HTH domain
MKKSAKDHIGKRIKKLRAFNGMTQEEMAQAINKTRSMVSHIERTGEVNHHTLTEIAKVLKLPVEQLEFDPKDTITLQDSASMKKSEQDLVLQLKEENMFLKSTIQNQWKLLFELAK